MPNFLFTLKRLIDSYFKRSKTYQLELLAQPYVEKVPLLDTEYIATVSASPKEASFLAQHIDLYRTTIRPDLKDILLYRIGAYMEIFSAEDKGIEDIIIEQHNWRLSQKQRQKVIQFLAERFGIAL